MFVTFEPLQRLKSPSSGMMPLALIRNGRSSNFSRTGNDVSDFFMLGLLRREGVIDLGLLNK